MLNYAAEFHPSISPFLSAQQIHFFLLSEQAHLGEQAANYIKEKRGSTQGDIYYLGLHL